MSIDQLNLYTPGQNLSNLAVNVDYNRLQEHKIEMTIDFTAHPADVTILEGSIIECNGNRYVLTADEVFTMANNRILLNIL